MAKPPPDPGENNWRRIKATVKPLKRTIPPIADGGVASTASRGGSDAKRAKAPPSALPSVAPDLIRGRSRPDTTPPPAPVKVRSGTVCTAALAHDWERSLRTGRISPEMTVDLHGHNLAGAHAALSRALDGAATQGARIILVIAGKSRGPDEAPRGAIRRELETWLSHSHHARRILAVRNAHPRHGGAGAVYVVLRKG